MVFKKVSKRFYFVSNLFIGLFLLVVFIYLSGFYLPLFLQFVLMGILIGFLLILRKTSFINNSIGKIFFLFLASIISVRYWLWRTTETIFYTNWIDFTGTMILYLAETFGIALYITGIFVNLWPIRRKPIPISTKLDNLPTVDIFIPTINEPEDMVKISLIGCKHIDYPKDKVKIYLLDDGATLQRRMDPKTKEEAWKRYFRFKKMAEDLGAIYIAREKNEHAKAGNINYALKKSYGDLILVLDSDHIPTRDILKNTVGWFLKDKKLFLVQTPHFFINPDPVEKNLGTFSDAPTEQQMFYEAIHPGLDFWNSSFFCGSAAILRRKYLEEIGGLKGRTVTEDAETSIDLHSKGLNSIYIPIPMVCGLNPETYDSLITQRTRWAQGMVQIFMTKNPLFKRGLKFYQKICYLNCCLFWFFGIARIIFLLTPVGFLVAGINVYFASVPQALAYTLPHLISATIVGNFLYGKVRWAFFSELYESIQSIFVAPAIISAIIRPKKPTFKVTPKGVDLKKDFLNPLGKPFYLLLLAIIFAFPFAVMKWFHYPLYRDVILICGAWNAFNFLLVLACLGVVWERRQIRRFHRAWTKGKAVLYLNGNRIEGEVKDVSLGGIGIEVDKKYDLKKGDKINITTKDSYGYEYYLKIEVVRTSNIGKKVYLGCRFLLDTKEDFENLVKFVYGDSKRWILFWQRKSKHMSSIRSFIYLVSKGLRGSIYNLKNIPKIIKEVWS